MMRAHSALLGATREHCLYVSALSSSKLLSTFCFLLPVQATGIAEAVVLFCRHVELTAPIVTIFLVAAIGYAVELVLCA